MLFFLGNYSQYLQWCQMSPVVSNLSLDLTHTGYLHSSEIFNFSLVAFGHFALLVLGDVLLQVSGVCLAPDACSVSRDA